MAAALPEERLVNLMEHRIQFAMMCRAGNAPKVLQNVITKKEQALKDKTDQFAQVLLAKQDKIESAIGELTQEVSSLNVFEADQQHVANLGKVLQTNQTVEQGLQERLAKEKQQLSEQQARAEALRNDLASLKQALNATPKVLPLEVQLNNISSQAWKQVNK